MTSKAGSSRASNAEITRIKREIREVMDGVLGGDIERGRGSVYATLAGVLKGYLELERRIKETEKLAREVEELKAMVEGSRGYGWRA